MKAIYFSHDTNSFYDPKIRILVGKHGIWAYAAFWIILEMMATQKDYHIQIEGFAEGLYPIFQGKNINAKSDSGLVFHEDDSGEFVDSENIGRFSICLAEIKVLLEDMIDVGLFQVNDSGTFYSESLLERMSHRDEVSLKRMESGRLGGLSKSKQMLSKPLSKCLAVKESKVKESKEEKSRGIFSPPTFDELKTYCTKNNLSIQTQRFLDFYSSKGWMVGKNKMKDWQAAVRNWASRDDGTLTQTQVRRNPQPNKDCTVCKGTGKFKQGDKIAQCFCLT